MDAKCQPQKSEPTAAGTMRHTGTLHTAGENVIQKPMDHRRRDMMLRIIDDVSTQNDFNLITTFLYHMDRLSRCEHILKWLILNRLTGKNFSEWVKINRFSPLSLSKYVLMKIRKDSELKPIFAGKDYLV